MGAAYSQDLRDRIMAARDDGMPTKRVAEQVVANEFARIMREPAAR